MPQVVSGAGHIGGFYLDLPEFQTPGQEWVYGVDPASGCPPVSACPRLPSPEATPHPVQFPHLELPPGQPGWRATCFRGWAAAQGFWSFPPPDPRPEGAGKGLYVVPGMWGVVVQGVAGDQPVCPLVVTAEEWLVWAQGASEPEKAGDRCQ